MKLADYFLSRKNNVIFDFMENHINTLFLSRLEIKYSVEWGQTSNNPFLNNMLYNKKLCKTICKKYDQPLAISVQSELVTEVPSKHKFLDVQSYISNRKY